MTRTLLTTALLLAMLAVPGAQGRESDWRSASPDDVLQFPADHASHPDYGLEWWYYTGNLQAPDGRAFGFQVTFFRVGIDRSPSNPSRWAVRDLFMAHLAVTDLSSGRHLFAERLNRGGVGWAGAATDRLSVWNDDWRVEAVDGAHVLEARSDDRTFGVDLRLIPLVAPVLHGRNGFSQKGRDEENASHYYSLTRLATSGSLIVDGQAVEVSGLSWMDHEFGTTFLEASQEGWDWFSLQLDDGTDVMLYVLRQAGGSRHPRSSGTIRHADGRVEGLDDGDYRVSPGPTWTSPESGARYPVAWRIEIPAAALTLDVRTALDAQELRTPESTGVTYWEGAVSVSGTHGRESVSGRGYLEMTGYAGRPMSDVLRRTDQSP